MANESNQQPGELTESQTNPRKVIERAMILPIIGLLLLIPPLASIFEIDARLFGIPFTLLYLFGAWAILIFATYRLSRRLQDLEDKSTDIEGPEEAQQDARQ